MDPRARQDRRPPPPRAARAGTYALVGALLGQGAPAGAALLESLLAGGTPLSHASAQPLLYGYMSVATGLAFATFGYVLGRDADRLLADRRRLARLSDVDALTRVLNRRAVLHRLQAELKRSARDGTVVGLLMLDLDHFKRVNDRHGHAVGDRVLRRVGRCLRRMARASDSVGRLGGEEFLVVLPDADIADAARSAERLRAALAEPPANTAVPPITVSVGVHVAGGGDTDMQQCLRLADEALYRAKRDGRNRVCLSPASQDARSMGRREGGSGSIRPERTSR